MYRVKLIKGLSYTGAIHATKAKPFVDVEDKNVADAAVASGYFELVDAADETNVETATPAEDLTKMTVPQLEAYAADRGIDLSGKTKKADIIKAIEAAQTDDADETAADYSDDE